MDILTNDKGEAVLDLRYPLMSIYTQGIDFKEAGHEELAERIASHGLKTYMVITVADMLADEHWDDPAYMHKTNHICVGQALYEVRREMTNRYFSREKLEELIKKYKFPTTEFNFKPDEGRRFTSRLEDELFSYQETVALVKLMIDILRESKYKLDDEGYPLENEDGDYIPEEDPAVIEAQKELLLERYLIPQVRTQHNRVYNMPSPFDHWDSRSSWHQGFYVEIPKDGATISTRGNCGSSGARETNGRWAHTFGLLANKYGIETPTFFMRYDAHNVWREEFRLDTFATLGRDLSGNYSSSREIMKPLFDGRTWTPAGSYPENHRYEKVEKDFYW